MFKNGSIFTFNDKLYAFKEKSQIPMVSEVRTLKIKKNQAKKQETWVLILSSPLTGCMMLRSHFVKFSSVKREEGTE